MKKLVLTLLRLYKAFLSPYLGTLSKCRFTPTCSHYTYQAVEKYGALKGCYMGLKRFAKCNPLFKGGFDPLQ